jgi:spermidine/putrescine transport system permease protein
MNEERKLSRAARLTKWLVSGPPLLFLLLLVAVPSVIMVFASFRYPGEFGGLAPLAAADPRTLHGFTTETYRFFFSDFIYTEVFIKSFVMALATTLICLIVAYPLALLIARSQKQSRSLMMLLVILPFTSNFLIGIYAWMIILGPQAALNQIINVLLGVFGIAPVQLLFSPFAVMIAMVYVYLPFMVLPLYTNLEKHDPVLLDAAQDLGANAWQRFWRVTFPLSQPGIFAGCALVFIPAIGMFAVPELLGGTGDIMIGNLIKEQFLGTRDWPFGSTLAILLTLAVLLVVWIVAKLSARGGRYA